MHNLFYAECRDNWMGIIGQKPVTIYVDATLLPEPTVILKDRTVTWNFDNMSVISSKLEDNRYSIDEVLVDNTIVENYMIPKDSILGKAIVYA